MKAHKNKYSTLSYYTGILGVSLFVASVFNSGHLIEGYSHLSQFISESYASNTEYGLYLRLLGFIPSGVLILWFSFFVANGFSAVVNQSIAKVGLIGFGITYGLFTVLTSVFVCDAGCEGESLNQILHNVLGFLTYLTVPIFILLIGKGLSKNVVTKPLGKKFTILGFFSIVSVVLFFSFYDSNIIGLLQRLTEALFLLPILLCYLLINRTQGEKYQNQY